MQLGSNRAFTPHHSYSFFFNSSNLYPHSHSLRHTNIHSPGLHNFGRLLVQNYVSLTSIIIII